VIDIVCHFSTGGDETLVGRIVAASGEIPIARGRLGDGVRDLEWRVDKPVDAIALLSGLMHKLYQITKLDIHVRI
jgi:hypothetical protein